MLGQLNLEPMVLTHTPTAAGPGHALTAGLKVHHLPGGLYTLRHARPNYPLAGLTYEERARARAAGKAADMEALMELKGQVVEDAEGLLNSWQEGQDPCTFERVGEGLAQLALHDVSACMQATASTLQLCSTLLHCAAAAQQGALLHAVILQAELLLGRQATHRQNKQAFRFVACCRCSAMPTQAVCLRLRLPPPTTSWTTTPSCATS